MQFLVLGFDGKDKKAPERRLAARPGHLELSEHAVKRGEQLMGTAILDEEGNMKGSAMLVDFPSRKALDKWLAEEPYVTGKVWKRIEVHPCRVGPSFQHLIPQKVSLLEKRTLVSRKRK